MATRPTQSLSGWAASGTIATSIPPAEVAQGQQAGNPIPAAWINLFGAWGGYLADLSPADDVLAFREWECPDDNTYDLRWSTSVDGRLNGQAAVVSLTAAQWSLTDNAIDAGFQVASGSSLVQVFNSASGGAVRIASEDPTTPGDLAGLTIDADSGDVTLASDYGLISIGTASDTISVPGNVSAGEVVADRYRYQSATTFSKSWCPSHFADVNGNGANNVAAFAAAGWTAADPGGLSDGDVLCWGLLGSLEPVAIDTGTPTQVRVFWRQAAGSGAVTIEVVAVAVGGGETVVASGDLPDGTSTNQSTVLGSLAGSISISQTFFVRASSKGGALGTVKVFGVDIQYTRMDAR